MNITTSTVVQLGDIAYYMRQEAEPTPSAGNGQADQPCTVLQFGITYLTEGFLKSTIVRFKNCDDVWSKRFLLNIVLQIDNEEIDSEELLPPHSAIQPDTKKFLKMLGNQDVYAIRVPRHSAAPEGPYFLRNGKLHAAYRLYPDTAGAFIVSTVPKGHDPFQYQSLNATAYGETFPSSLTIAVPSRLYFTPTKEKPGKRVGIIDVIDLKGLRTGASCRAYTQLYSPRSKNAAVVQKLLDQGFVIVGKTKTTQFADCESPTGEWMDYQAPFNPVADGYQRPNGGSAGSAAAVASYPWLDFAIGTDTSGGTRAPAAAQGIFGIRPTFGTCSFEGIIPYSSEFDTLGGFARDAGSLTILAKALYGSTSTFRTNLSSINSSSSFTQIQDTKSKQQKPKTILYPEQYWPVAHPESQAVFESFLTDLENYLDVKRTPINLEDIWQSTKPVDTDLSLQDYLKHIFPWVAHLDQWNSFLKQFLRDYQTMHRKPPLLNPQLEFKTRHVAPSISLVNRENGLESLYFFRIWFEENIIPRSTDGNSDTILITPWTHGQPDYRDKNRADPKKSTGTESFFYDISSYAMTPEIIVPVGKTWYVSKVTNAKEWLPTCVGITGAKGTDFMLAEFLRDFWGTRMSAVMELK